MARIQVTVLAVLVAAVVLFGLGYVVDPATPPAALRSAVTAAPGTEHDGADRKRIALWNSERESRRGPQGPGGDEPRGPARRRGAMVVGGAERGDGSDAVRPRGGFVSEGVVDEDGGASRGVATELIAARAGGIPAAPAAKPQAPSEPDSVKRHVFELGDPNDAANRDLLLSVPFNGSAAAAKGADATVADGLLFDGDSVEFTNDAQVVFPAAGNVKGAEGTISFSIDPQWAGVDLTNNSLLQIRDENDFSNNLQIVKNLDSLRFIIVDGHGTESNVNVSIADWQPNQQHQVAATWDGVGMVLYLDGKQVGTAQLSHQLAFGDSTPIHVGSDFPGASYSGAGGSIKDLRVYGRALGADEVG